MKLKHFSEIHSVKQTHRLSDEMKIYCGNMITDQLYNQ